MSARKKKEGGQAPSYGELLRDPRWQKKRLEILERDGWACVFCDNTEETLHVHHRRYDFGKKPWEYDEHVYQTLCHKCHAEVTDLTRDIKECMGRLEPTITEYYSVLGYLQGQEISWYPNGSVEIRTAEHAEGIAAVFELTASELFGMCQERTTDGKVSYVVTGWDLSELRSAKRKRLRGE